MSAEIEIRPTTCAEWYALEEERDQLRDELDRLLAELAASRDDVEQARRELEDERDRVNVQREDIRELRRQIAELQKLVANVPSLIQSAFCEGFGVDGGAYGAAWDASRARKILDGEAIPRPLEWDADKHRIAVLEAVLSNRPVSRILKDGEVAVRADILSAMNGCIAALRADAELIPSKALDYLDALRSKGGE